MIASAFAEEEDKMIGVGDTEKLEFEFTPKVASTNSSVISIEEDLEHKRLIITGLKIGTSIVTVNNEKGQVVQKITYLVTMSGDETSGLKSHNSDISK